MSILVKRGIVQPRYSKERILQNISESDADNWRKNSLGYEIREVVSDVSKKSFMSKLGINSLMMYQNLKQRLIQLQDLNSTKMEKYLRLVI